MSDGRDDLRARVEDAVAELAAIRHTDPAAREAIRTVRLTARTLRSFWVPALDTEIDAADDDDP